MKKTVCFIVSLLLCLCLFAACSKKPASTDSAATETDGRFVPSVTFPKVTDTDVILNPDGTDPVDVPPDSGTSEAPALNLALLSDAAATEALVSLFEASRFHFDIHFNALQTVSSPAGTLAEWSGSVWQLGGEKRCEYTLNGKAYKAWVARGVYYWNQYDESGIQSLKKDTSAKAKSNYLSQQEAYYDAIWNLSAAEFSQITLTRNGSSGYTLNCANPSERALNVLSSVSILLDGKQVTALNNVSLTASFDKDGVLKGYSYSFDLTAAETEGSLSFRAQFSDITHDSAQISVSAPENAGDYKE